jgi:hypothetical protein
MKLSCLPKFSKNFQINQRKKKEKLPTATIKKTRLKIIKSEMVMLTGREKTDADGLYPSYYSMLL